MTNQSRPAPTDSIEAFDEAAFDRQSYLTAKAHSANCPGTLSANILSTLPDFKRYSPPATPCDRLLLHEAVRDEFKEQLTRRRASLDPVALLHAIREAQAALVALSSPCHGESQPSRRAWSSSCPNCPPCGSRVKTVLPRSPDQGTRHCRTRSDPFEGAWQHILGWLETEPDITARTILDRLCSHRPDRFSDTHLRTLQRGVKKRRGVMARKLVYASPDQSAPTLLSMPEDVPVGADHRV